ncbi:MAG: hypothetical protein R3F00_01510 [Dokdonella sp.]
MRQILVDQARLAQADKRNAGLQQVTLGDGEVQASAAGLSDLDLALDDLERIDPGASAGRTALFRRIVTASHRPELQKRVCANSVP